MTVYVDARSQNSVDQTCALWLGSNEMSVSLYKCTFFSDIYFQLLLERVGFAGSSQYLSNGVLNNRWSDYR